MEMDERKLKKEMKNSQLTHHPSEGGHTEIASYCCCQFQHMLTFSTQPLDLSHHELYVVVCHHQHPLFHMLHIPFPCALQTPVYLS